MTLVVPHLYVHPRQTKMHLLLPHEFLQGDEVARLHWVRNSLGKAVPVPVEGDVYRPSRQQFWRLLDAVVAQFSGAVVSVDRTPGTALPAPLGAVGWKIVHERSTDAGMVRRVWVVTSETMRRTPSRSEFLWRRLR